MSNHYVPLHDFTLAETIPNEHEHLETGFVHISELVAEAEERYRRKLRRRGREE